MPFHSFAEAAQLPGVDVLASTWNAVEQPTVDKAADVLRAGRDTAALGVKLAVEKALRR